MKEISSKKGKTAKINSRKMQIFQKKILTVKIISSEN